jgi:hypothetical protein
VESNVEQCPLCGTELSRVKFREIQAKLREEEQRKANDLAQAERNLRLRIEQEFRVDLEKQKQVAEKRAKEEAQQQINKAQTERDQLAEKLKKAQEHEAETLKQAREAAEKQKTAAERKVREEVAQQMKNLAAERDAAAKKLKDAQEREAGLLKKATEEADAERQKELAKQRQVLEAENKITLLKQQATFARERESYQRQMQQLETKLQKKTAAELGDGAQIDLCESLRERFDADKITLVAKGEKGADILHEIRYKGESCGKILIESKNQQRWSWDWVPKLRQDQMDAKAEHAILATTTFPAGKKEICIESDVIVVAPARAVYVVEIFRNAMITMHVRGLSLKQRSTKMARLYKLITSESYSHKLREAGKLADRILDLDVDEKKTHDNVWKKRGSLTTQMRNVLREIETDVAAVIEGTDEEEAVAAFPVKSVASTSAAGGSEERIIWSKH